MGGDAQSESQATAALSAKRALRAVCQQRRGCDPGGGRRLLRKASRSTDERLHETPRSVLMRLKSLTVRCSVACVRSSFCSGGSYPAES